MDYRLLLSDGGYRHVSVFQLSDLYHQGKANLRDVVYRDGQHWLVGEVLGQALGSARLGIRGVPIPSPPKISWSTIAIIGGLTGGYGLAVIALLQGLWSRRVKRSVLAVLLPLFSIVAVPIDLAWDIHIVSQHLPSWTEFLRMVLDLLVVDGIAVGAVVLASLCVRRALLSKLAKEGFQMSFILTLFFGPSYVAYKAQELSETSR
jgi:hypothetical protein